MIGMVYPIPTEEILEEENFIYLTNKKWKKELEKILEMNPQVSILCIKSYKILMNKLMIEILASNENHGLNKKYPMIEENQIKKRNFKEMLQTPNNVLEKALDIKYIKKFKLHNDGSKIDDTVALSMYFNKSIEHASYTTNLHYALLLMSAKSDQNQTKKVDF